MGFNSKYRILLLALALLSPQLMVAQFRVPPFDVEVKVAQSLIPTFDHNSNTPVQTDVLEATSIFGAAHLQLGQHFAIGWLYSRSFRGTVKFSTNSDSGSNPPSEQAFQLVNGPDLRISSGRGKKTRWYLSLNYTQVEFIDQKSGYRLAHQCNAAGASVGIMKRLSNTVYFNIIELGARALLGEKAFWLNSDLMIEAKTGFTFNFSRRK